MRDALLLCACHLSAINNAVESRRLARAAKRQQPSWASLGRAPGRAHAGGPRAERGQTVTSDFSPAMSTARFAVQPLAAVSRASRSHSSSASLRRSQPRRHVAARASLLVQGDLSTTLFALGQQADAAVRLNLESVTPATYALVLVRAQL